VKCQYCDREEALPFKCQYCKGFFCAEHRLPENHACPEGWRARAFHEEAPQSQPQPVKEGKSPYEYTVTYTPFGLKKPKRFSFSQTELKHLTVSALLVMLVGASGLFFAGAQLIILMSAAIIFALIFLSHEIAHKLVAQHYGMWAEFRLTMLGALITLVSIISPLKLISPGAVMIAGSGDKEKVGKTAIAGPAVNIVWSIVSFAFTFILKDQWFLLLALFSTYISAFIAVFNLIPIGILDGWKVFNWNKLIWGIAFALSLALLIMIFANPTFSSIL
jgi:Zn-dependent protease